MSDGGHLGNTLDRGFVLAHLHALGQHLEGIADRTKGSDGGDVSPEDASAAVSAIKTVQEAREALRSPLLSTREPERTATLEERRSSLATPSSRSCKALWRSGWSTSSGTTSRQARPPRGRL